MGCLCLLCSVLYDPVDLPVSISALLCQLPLLCILSPVSCLLRYSGPGCTQADAPTLSPSSGSREHITDQEDPIITPGPSQSHPGCCNDPILIIWVPRAHHRPGGFYQHPLTVSVAPKARLHEVDRKSTR